MDDIEVSGCDVEDSGRSSSGEWPARACCMASGPLINSCRDAALQEGTCDAKFVYE